MERWNKRWDRIWELVHARELRQLWIEFGFYSNSSIEVQDYPNGMFYPTEEDEKARERFKLERKGLPIPLHLMAAPAKERKRRKLVLSSVAVEDFEFPPIKGASE